MNVIVREPVVLGVNVKVKLVELMVGTIVTDPMLGLPILGVIVSPDSLEVIVIDCPVPDVPPSK